MQRTDAGRLALDSLADTTVESGFVCKVPHGIGSHQVASEGKLCTRVSAGGLAAYGVGMTAQESRRSARCALLFSIRHLGKGTESLKAFLKDCGQPESIADRVAECLSRPLEAMPGRVIRVKGEHEMASGLVPDTLIHLEGLNPFVKLGVTCDVTEEEIGKAYRRMARLHHPDKGVGSNDSMQELNNARDYLLAMGAEKTWFETHPKVRPGDWVRLPDGKCGRVSEWNGRELRVQVDGQTIVCRGCELVAVPDTGIDSSHFASRSSGSVHGSSVPGTSPHAAAAAGMPTETICGKRPCIGPGDGKECIEWAWLLARKWRLRCRTCEAAAGRE